MHVYSTVELMEEPLWADSSTRELFPALSLTGPFARPAPPLSCSGSWAFLRWRIKAIRYNLYIHVSNFQKYVFTCSSFNEIQRQNKSFFPGFFSHTGGEYHILKGVFHPVIEINFCGCHGRGTKDNWVTGDQRHFGWPKPPKSKELGGPKCRWDQRTRWTKSSRNNLIYYRKLSVIQVHRKVIQFWLGYLMFYSKHHAAERWDLEFGSNTTEKFENSLKNLKTHWKI